MKYLFFLLILFNLVFYLWETGVGRTRTQQAQSTTLKPSKESVVLLKGSAGKPTDPMAPAEVVYPRNTEETQATSSSPMPSGQQADTVTATSEAKPTSEASEEPCHWLGSFSSLKKAQSALKLLGISSSQAKPIKRPTEVENGYSLLYPAAINLQEAQANRKMLAEKGFKDAWLVENGENQYAISLAYLTNKERANEALARYQSQGIPVELKPHILSAEKWWLEIKGSIDATALQAKASQLDKDSSGVVVRACE